ncbi:MAG TPA: capsule assembly Wzi family protein [Candidatus Binataceae bacterium]|nr:capsule assembly Wzi family protein [Candidatus Binataceae bacterium]
MLSILIAAGLARASTYVVYIPLNSSIYQELDTLDGLGWLDTYLAGIKPISRVEAARLTLEAEHNLTASENADALAETMIHVLREQLHDEIGWLEHDAEDDQPNTIHPIQQLEATYLYTRGQRRYMNQNTGSEINAEEATPLFPNNDGIPTSAGSNEIATGSAWAGLGGFLTAYGEGALAGPMTRDPVNTNRAQFVLGEGVVSLGNAAISFGQEEMWWGTGHFAALSQSNNAKAFDALRVQGIHPTLLPGFLRYLGPFRGEVFFGQLDHGREFSRPWIAGQNVNFKPLPTFEFGFTHAIMFGGRDNDHYGFSGFIGRATGFNTGSASSGNTNSRGGIYLKFRFPSLRDVQVYQEILGEDNLTNEVPGVGRFLPFLAVSYQGGVYVPRLTADGLTNLRFEYAILEPNYSTHSDSLYWTYDNQLMGDPMGPNASEIDLALGRWLWQRYLVDVDGFYTERAAKFGVPGLHKERSGGVAFDLLRLAQKMPKLRDALGEIRARAAVEYVKSINYAPDNNSLRFTLVLTGALTPALPNLTWNW